MIIVVPEPPPEEEKFGIGSLSQSVNHILPTLSISLIFAVKCDVINCLCSVVLHFTKHRSIQDWKVGGYWRGAGVEEGGGAWAAGWTTEEAFCCCCFWLA